MKQTIELGARYRDKVHGTEGVAAVHTEHLSGCDRVCLEYAKDGEIKCNWIDAPQVEMIEDARVKRPEKDEDRGGPGPVAPSRDPVR